MRTMSLIDLILPAKNVLVYYVAASESGALSVLNDFHNEVRNHEDKNIKWIFVISTPHLEETENIKVIRLPWVKKNWIYRLFCDHFVAPKIIKKNSIDKILSLQDVLVPHTNVPQILYLHQSLPFIEYRFKITDDFLLWVYQNILSILIFSGIKKAKKINVQTNWMKQACIEKIGVKEDKINVMPPVIKIKSGTLFSYENMTIPTFIYPATPLVYKNHRIIIEACKKLVNEGIDNFQVIFTITGKENELSKKLLEEVENHKLPIKFIGLIPREELFVWYAKSVLLFPSYIESYPLPLLEAKIHRCPILASDSPFSHEILDKYDDVIFFNEFDSNQLYVYLCEIVNCNSKNI